MPLFAVLFSGVMGALATFLAKFVTRKLAVLGAALTALSVLYVGLLITMNAILTPMLDRLFVTSYGQALGLAFPPAAGTCMAILAGAWAACALFKWQLRALTMSVQA